MEHLDKTVLFQKTELGRKDVKEVLGQVYDALEEKGYNSISQIVGYLLSGDPVSMLASVAIYTIIPQPASCQIPEAM